MKVEEGLDSVLPMNKGLEFGIKWGMWNEKKYIKKIYWTVNKNLRVKYV